MPSFNGRFQCSLPMLALNARFGMRASFVLLALCGATEGLALRGSRFLLGLRISRRSHALSRSHAITLSPLSRAALAADTLQRVAVPLSALSSHRSPFEPARALTSRGLLWGRALTVRSVCVLCRPRHVPPPLRLRCLRRLCLPVFSSWMRTERAASRARGGGERVRRRDSAPSANAEGRTAERGADAATCWTR
jgi:hypothetical protein